MSDLLQHKLGPLSELILEGTPRHYVIQSVSPWIVTLIALQSGKANSYEDESVLPPGKKGCDVMDLPEVDWLTFWQMEPN